jgi:hypothetical protein
VEANSRSSRRIFISYRHEDTAGHVLALLEPLRERFGAARVFTDIDGIDPGEDFVKALQRELASSAVALVVIGREWLTITDEQRGSRRLDDPQDIVRMEVATALQSDHIRVVPVLVGRATMPKADQLPVDLQPLARRHALELSHNRWKADVDRLIKVLGIDDPPLVRRHRLRTAAIAVVILGSALVGARFVTDWLAPSGPAGTEQSPGASGDEVQNDRKRLAALIEGARSNYRNGRRSEALGDVVAGLAIDADSAGLLELLSAMASEAQTAARQAEQQATSSGAQTLAALEFKRGLTAKGQATTLVDAKDLVQALPHLWVAAEAFTQAALQAAENARARKEQDEKDKQKRLLAEAADRRKIEGVLERFRSAYARKDLDGIRAVYPKVQPDFVSRHKNCASVNLAFDSRNVQLLQSTRARGGPVGSDL